MADLVNASRTSEEEVGVTDEMIHDEWTDPRLDLDHDTWVAVDETGRYLAAAEVWFGEPDYDRDIVIRHIGFTMLPDLYPIGADLMGSLFEQAIARGTNRPFAHPDKPYALRAWASALDEWKNQWLQRHGFRLTHVGYTMVYDDPATLPPVPAVAGVRFEVGSSARDSELRNAVNQAFSSDPTYTPLSGAEWDVLFDSAATPDAHWVLAIEEATDRVVGFAVAEIDRETNDATGQQDGWVMDLAVLPSYRGHRIGRALVLKAMNDLCEAGMTAIKMGIDSFDSPDEAMRLHQSLGFRILKGSHTYHRPLN